MNELVLKSPELVTEKRKRSWKKENNFTEYKEEIPQENVII